ncbi:unnamed protein product [Prunus armeniaca]|uniref:Uncharacterized protein n=1 Tax=Prunus armeniaca TaxID=36596 RepID=A0A6J5VUQ4_PRUAR|nr:unnamed protein product [Prunus armeniaca]
MGLKVYHDSICVIQVVPFSSHAWYFQSVYMKHRDWIAAKDDLPAFTVLLLYAAEVCRQVVFGYILLSSSHVSL